MDELNLRQAIDEISSQTLAQRIRWYSPAAEAYQSTRPKYPSELIGKVFEIAQLSKSSRILEIGCGPGTATLSFAELGCSMVCLEPNPDFYEMATMNCRSYPSVEIMNQSFEEWDLEPQAFDVVLAANSMHWIPADIGYVKASRALKDDGILILLWNKELQPCRSMQAVFAEIYNRHAPSLGHFQDRPAQERILSGLGQMILDSGRFNNLITATVESNLTYTSDQYITLLGTYSSYLKLDPQVRSALFNGLRQSMLEHGGDRIQLSYLSTYHMAQKKAIFD